MAYDLGLQGIEKSHTAFACCCPSMAALMDTLSHELGIYHYAVHLANVFFSIDKAQESQEQFAFMWEGWQWTFTVLPQGYLHSPTFVMDL